MKQGVKVLEQAKVCGEARHWVFFPWTNLCPRTMSFCSPWNRCTFHFTFQLLYSLSCRIAGTDTTSTSRLLEPSIPFHTSRLNVCIKKKVKLPPPLLFHVLTSWLGLIQCCAQSDPQARQSQWSRVYDHIKCLTRATIIANLSNVRLFSSPIFCWIDMIFRNKNDQKSIAASLNSTSPAKSISSSKSTWSPAQTWKATWHVSNAQTTPPPRATYPQFQVGVLLTCWLGGSLVWLGFRLDGLGLCPGNFAAVWKQGSTQTHGPALTNIPEHSLITPLLQLCNHHHYLACFPLCISPDTLQTLSQVSPEDLHFVEKPAWSFKGFRKSFNRQDRLSDQQSEVWTDLCATSRSIRRIREI